MIRRLFPHLLATAILLSPAFALAENAGGAPAAAGSTSSSVAPESAANGTPAASTTSIAPTAPPSIATQTNAPTPSASTDLGSSLLQLGFGFVVVMAVLFGCLWLLKRLSTSHGRSGGLMKVVSTLPLGTRERAVLIEVGGQWLLIGMGPSYMVKLAELPRQELPPAPHGAMVPDFSAWLKRALERNKGSDTNA
ncbi:MAG TPA: flagellar biosynthetic protein FliO [Rhodocyclaceae bacterium]|nr:flagellar biosynthetic protein FliO [Rhodocyclaceae bacterium]